MMEVGLFDRTTHRQILEYIPFADHNAMQDPSCSDITGILNHCPGTDTRSGTNRCVERSSMFGERSAQTVRGSVDGA